MSVADALKKDNLKGVENMNEPKCCGCKYAIDAFGNYTECGKAAEEGTHMFIDWHYWNNESPDKCPLKKIQQPKQKTECWGLGYPPCDVCDMECPYR